MMIKAAPAEADQRRIDLFGSLALDPVPAAKQNVLLTKPRNIKFQVGN